MTFGEIKNYIMALTNKIKNDISKNYGLAVMISSFTNRASHGKPAPSLEELYPSLFKSEVKKSDDQYWAMQKELLIDFANKANQQRRKQ